jgi:hypothetical protein
MSTYEKECLVVLMEVDKWKSYLQHKEFIISTDHRSLLHLSDQQLTTGIQHKAFLKLLGLHYKIVYKKGKKMLQQMPCLEALQQRNCLQFLNAN